MFTNRSGITHTIEFLRDEHNLRLPCNHVPGSRGEYVIRSQQWENYQWNPPITWIAEMPGTDLTDANASPKPTWERLMEVQPLATALAEGRHAYKQLRIWLKKEIYQQLHASYVTLSDMRRVAYQPGDRLANVIGLIALSRDETIDLSDPILLPGGEFGSLIEIQTVNLAREYLQATTRQTNRFYNLRNKLLQDLDIRLIRLNTATVDPVKRMIASEDLIARYAQRDTLYKPQFKEIV